MSDIPGWYDWQEFYAEMICTAPDHAAFVEVGVWLGKSIVDLAQRARATGRTDLDFYGVDTFEATGGTPEMQETLRKLGGSTLPEFMRVTDDLPITPVVGSSVEAARDFLDDDLFMVFIDASHDYESVKADLAAWWPKVASGGWLAGHDALFPDVERAVRERFPQRVIQRNIWRVQK